MQAKGIIDFLTEKDLIICPTYYQTAMKLTLDQSFMALPWSKFELLRSLKVCSIPATVWIVFQSTLRMLQWVLREHCLLQTSFWMKYT